MLFFVGDSVGEDVAVDVRGDDDEDQALEFGRLQRLHLPLHGTAGVEAVAAGEGRPPRVAVLALGREQLVGAHLLVGQIDRTRL
ncbi:hypothetical protein ACFY2H_40535 [Streptomyces griseofuscus]|uniref:hypothetical protein n=1 Tax=Streptomyces griseofuscus TaxID=146922 RepID=UPI00368001A2